MHLIKKIKLIKLLLIAAIGFIILFSVSKLKFKKEQTQIQAGLNKFEDNQDNKAIKCISVKKDEVASIIDEMASIIEIQDESQNDNPCLFIGCGGFL